jgi:hypothetical protein
MKIETLKTADLIPYARNSRTHSDAQVAQIAGSIREFGFTNPVLIDTNNGIIAGHGRVMAAGKLGLDKVPCIRLAHLTDTQKRAYIIADNKLALNAGWDEEMLTLELGELADIDFDMDLIGFTEDELAGLLAETTEGEQSKSPIESSIPRPTGLGPYHVKDACIGCFAVKSTSSITDHKEVIAMKRNNPEVFAKRLIADFSEMFNRPGPKWPRFHFVTVPASKRESHPMIAVADAVANLLGTERKDIFCASNRKTRGIHAEEKQQILSSAVENCSILLLDDVITTGRTIRACVNAIHEAGGNCRPFAWITYQ